MEDFERLFNQCHPEVALGFFDLQHDLIDSNGRILVHLGFEQVHPIALTSQWNRHPRRIIGVSEELVAELDCERTFENGILSVGLEIDWSAVSAKIAGAEGDWPF